MVIFHRYGDVYQRVSGNRTLKPTEHLSVDDVHNYVPVGFLRLTCLIQRAAQCMATGRCDLFPLQQYIGVVDFVRATIFDHQPVDIKIKQNFQD